MASRKVVTAKEAAVKVLLDADGPLHIRDISERVLANHRTGLKGKTPQATIAAHLHVASKNGDTFKKVGRGMFDLIDRAAAKKAAQTRPSSGTAKRASSRRPSSRRREPVAA